MWLWKSEQVNYVGIKLKGTDGKKGQPPTDLPVFEDSRTGESNGKFDGDLLSIKLKEATEKYPYPQVQMKFIDEELETFIVSVWFNSALENLVNCFYWGVKEESNFKELNLSLYMNGDFPSIGIWKDWEQMKRGLDPKTVYNPLKNKVKVNGKEITDREEIDKFLNEKILLINDYLKWLTNDKIEKAQEEKVWEKLEAEAKVREEALEEKEAPVDPATKEVDESSDLPF